VVARVFVLAAYPGLSGAEQKRPGPSTQIAHESFRDRGIAAVGLTEEYVGGDTSPHNHRATDTAATVNLDYLELAARLAGQVIVTAVAVP
jgi:hypothetical protein